MYRILLFLLLTVPLTGHGFDHSDWEAALIKFVDDKGFVDYDKLLANRDQFDRYLQKIKTQGPNSTPELFKSRADELAYYINAYNALVFEGVINRGPERKSVWRGLISGLNFFTLMDVELDGDTTTLKKLEDDIIRAIYKDPRIHAAINCASVSCPRLRREAYSGEHLERQLDESIREFVTSPAHLMREGDTVYISKIFDWFEEDFVKTFPGASDAESVINYINAYRPADDKLPQDIDVEYLDYDKSINAQPRP